MAICKQKLDCFKSVIKSLIFKICILSNIYLEIKVTKNNATTHASINADQLDSIWRSSESPEMLIWLQTNHRWNKEVEGVLNSN